MPMPGITTPVRTTEPDTNPDALPHLDPDRLCP